jgi:hypothetical protein
MDLTVFEKIKEPDIRKYIEFLLCTIVSWMLSFLGRRVVRQPRRSSE